MFEDKAFVYEMPLLELSEISRAAFVAEMMIRFGILQPGPGVRLPAPHWWPLRWWSASLVTFVNVRTEGLAARALVLAPGCARTPRDVLYLDKLWSMHPRRGAGRTLMNVLVMMAEDEGLRLRWRARDPTFYRRWAEARSATPPVLLSCVHDRDYVHCGAAPFRCWEAEDVHWLRMPSAWEEGTPSKAKEPEGTPSEAAGPKRFGASQTAS